MANIVHEPVDSSSLKRLTAPMNFRPAQLTAPRTRIFSLPRPPARAIFAKLHICGTSSHQVAHRVRV